jgi:hypothetical protein
MNESWGQNGAQKEKIWLMKMAWRKGSAYMIWYGK